MCSASPSTLQFGVPQAIMQSPCFPAVAGFPTPDLMNYCNHAIGNFYVKQYFAA